MSGYRSRRSVAGATVRWLGRLVLLALALLVGASVVVVVGVPRMTQGAAMTVLTGSMTPEIPVGSVVLVRPVDPRTLDVGDIATYQVEPNKEVFITHRITEIHDEPEGLSFTFKGDANKGADLEQISSDAVRGEVWFHVPYLGAIRDGLHGQGGITLVVMILLGGYAVSQLSGGLKDRRRRGGRSETRALSIGRPAALAQLRMPPGESATDLARRWGALILDQDGETVTLLIMPPDDGMAAALELLASQDPVRVEVWDAESVLTGVARPAPRPQGDKDETAADHVSG